jgi:hypothetical protein
VHGWRKPGLLLPVTDSGISNNTTQNQRKLGKLSLVVTALAPMLRGRQGRNLGDNDGTTRHLSGRSVRVLAFHLRRANGGQVGLAFCLEQAG